MLNTAEYNFSHNEFYPTAKSEFTLQLTVHPVGPTTQRVQVLADKAHEWRLLINAQGQIVSKTPRGFKQLTVGARSVAHSAGGLPATGGV